VGRFVGRFVRRFVVGVGVGGLEDKPEDGSGVGDNDGLGEVSHGGGTSGHSIKLFVQHSGFPFL